MEVDKAISKRMFKLLEHGGVPWKGFNLKIGVPTIILCNINETLQRHTTEGQKITEVIERTTRTGPFTDDVPITRIPLIPFESPFYLKQLHFLVQKSFLITINKAQCQSIELCGQHLYTLFFLHELRLALQMTFYLFACQIVLSNYMKLLLKNFTFHKLNVNVSQRSIASKCSVIGVFAIAIEDRWLLIRFHSIYKT